MSDSISLGLALNNAFDNTLNMQLTNGQIDQYVANFVRQEWAGNRSYVESDIIRMANASGVATIDGNTVSHAAAKFIGMAIDRFRQRNNSGYGGGYSQQGNYNYGGGYNYQQQQPINVGNMHGSSNLQPLPGRHGNYSQPTTTHKTSEPEVEVQPEVVGPEVDPKAAGYDENITQIIQGNKNDYQCLNVGSNITVVRANKVTTNVLGFNVYTLKSTIPENSDIDFLRQFDELKNSNIKFIMSGVYPKYKVLDFPSKEMKELKAQINPLLTQTDPIAAIIKLIKKTPHHTYTVLEKAIVANINQLLRVYMVSDEFCGKNKVQIGAFDDIMDLLMIRDGPLLELASASNYRQHVGSLVLHVFKRWFGNFSLILDTREDLHTIQCCNSLMIRDGELHEKVNVNDLSDEDKVRFFEILDEQCIILVPTHVTLTNIIPDEVLVRLGTTDAGFVHIVKGAENMLDVALMSAMQPVTSNDARLIYDYSNYYGYSFIKDVTISLNIGLSLNANLTMSV